MEFNLIDKVSIEYVGGCSSLSKKRNPLPPPPPPPPKKKKVVSITRTHNCYYPLTLEPVLDLNEDEEDGITITTAGKTDASVGFKSFPKTSIELLLGDTELANQLNKQGKGCLRAHLTLTSSNTGKLMIETRGGTSVVKSDVDMFEGLLKLEETLPPNSLEFTVVLKDFEYDYDDGDNHSWRSYDENKRELIWKGLKLRRNEGGSASLESRDIKLPSEKWWKLWRHSRSTMFDGDLSVFVKVDFAAVAELYKKRFGKGSLATELGKGADMVILVGGNKDKEKGIKCHKAILMEMSPVFDAMFKADMKEAKESSLEIVDFSEAVIRAMIEFAYWRNLEDALKSSEMTLELLRLADKYEMRELKEILLHVIWSMPFSWFSADLAIKLFFFGKNAGMDLAEAEKKGWAVLKWYVKNDPDKLMESQEYTRWCENPPAVMEFLLQVLNKCKCN